MPTFKVSRSQKRSAASRRRYKYQSKSPWKSRTKKSKYSPKNKQRFVNRSNPIAENKQVEGRELSDAIGLNKEGNPIMPNMNVPPSFLNTEPLYDGELIVANKKNGAVGNPINTAVWHFNPDSCLYQTHGLDESQMVGRSTYQRLCAAKFLIRWPQPTMNTGHIKYDKDDYPDNACGTAVVEQWISDNNIKGLIPETAQNYHLYWGFVNTKMGLSGYTTPTATTATFQDIEDHINKRVQDFFNERQDRTAFIPKTSNTMKIIGKKRLTPPWDARTGRLPVSSYTDSDVSDGSIPDTLVKITWPINRKIHFQPTNLFAGDKQNDGSHGYGPATPTVFYKNFDWMPFAVIVNYNIDKLPANVTPPVDDNSFERDRRSPYVIVNDITYYRDS